jgi:hypothetical protein
MNREDFAWVALRALGLVCLWITISALFSFIASIPSQIYLYSHLPSSPEQDPLRLTGMLRQFAILGSEVVVYGCLAFYLLRKGKLAHRLLCYTSGAA